MWIFISHSTAKDDAAGRQRLLDVEAALKQAAAGPTGHDVLLDFERLEAGFNWRTQLDEWMATCHAAVLMLTPKALESPWVLKEATILAHRAARDKKFLLFPALLDGLTRPQLVENKRFSPLYLEAIQRIGGTQPADIADAVLGQLTALGSVPVTPFDSLVTALAVQLKGADDDQLEGICSAITGKPIAFQTSDKRHVRCAHEVARAIVTGSRGQYDSLGKLISALITAGLSKDAARTVLNLAAPLWVDSEAASPLADVAERNRTAKPDPLGQATSWATAINGDYVPNFTAGMYLRRAYLPETSTTFVNLHGGESERRLDDLTARLRDAVRTSPLLQNVSDAKVDAFLDRRTNPYFVLLPPPFPDRELLDALQLRYPRVTFIAQIEAERLATDGLGERVVPLRPPVDLDRELSALDEIVHADSIVSP